MGAVLLKGIEKSFGGTAVLRSIDLDIQAGEFLTLVGPSGCGKTTLLRILAGLDHADRGSVQIGDVAVDDLPPKARDVAMVFQSYALYPYMTVRENMALPLLMRRLAWWQRMPLIGKWLPGSRKTRREIDDTVLSTATPLGLAPLLERRPAQLSGGQRQRVALGRAMVRQPTVFLMDEPLSNLDAKLRTDTRAEIAQLHRTLGTTFVYVTHDQVEAMTMSDRVAVMMDGRILQLDTPQRIYDDPADLRVAEFVGTPKIALLRAVRDEGGWHVAGERWPLDVAGADVNEVQIGVRSEWWALREASAEAGDGEAIVRGEVAHLEALGPETLIHVRPIGQQSVLIARVAPEFARGLSIGAPLALATRQALVFDSAGQRLRGCGLSSPRRLEVVHG